MSGNISGFAVSYTAFGALLIYSGMKGTSLSATFTDLTKGTLNKTLTEPIVEPSNAGAVANAGTSATANGNLVTTAGSDNQNLNTIGLVLAGDYGYSQAAAAGIAGCIAGESGGDPESMEAGGGGGEGLIQWTPGSKLTADTGTITGPGATQAQRSADLLNQIGAIIIYNEAQGAGLVAMLNAQTDPVLAADFYSEHFERPAVQDSDVRAGVAKDVFAYIKKQPGGS